MEHELDEWPTAQGRASEAAIRRAVSATDLTHVRPALGHTVVPAPGSVLASPLNALWDPEPDYFYHWVRDAAVVMSVAPILRRSDDEAWQQRFADYVRFSLMIATRAGPETNPLRAGTGPEHQRFLRPDAELRALTSEALLDEPRVNADGTPDLERWSRPQFDGPALRALSCLAWDGAALDGMDALLALDLDHVLRHAAHPSIGPWEEEPPAVHGFILLAQRAALRAGTDRLDADMVGAAIARIEAALSDLWCEACGHLRASSAAAPGISDAGVVLGALLGDPHEATFGLADPRVIATANHVESWSRDLFAISSETAPLVGRWPDDRYFGGNPWLPTSLGFAEFHFRRAAMHLSEAERRGCLARGTAILDAVRRVVADAGPLPEQIDRTTGAPVACRDLTWSHAAFIAAVEARRTALKRSAQ